MGMFDFALQSARKPTAPVAQGPVIQPSFAVGSTFVWYDNTFNQDPNTKYPTITAELGAVWFEEDNGGYGVMNGFQYIKTEATLACGQLVAGSAGVADTAVTGSSTSVVKCGTGGAAITGDIGSLLYIENGGVNPQLRVIKTAVNSGGTYLGTVYTNGAYVVSVRDLNTTSTQLDADILPYIPTNTTNIQVLRPFNRIICTASLVPLGVALGAVTYTVNPFTVVQVAGIAMIQSTTGAHVVGVPMIPAASGQVDSTIGTGSIYSGPSIYALDSFTPGGAGNLYPFAVNFLGLV